MNAKSAAVRVLWRDIESEDDALWDCQRVLYAYHHRSEVLYIGKAAGATSSVRRRFDADDKDGFFRDLKRERGIVSVLTMVGDMDYNGNFSKAMLDDVESLLINRIRPWGNIQSIGNRISRPGMTVVCSGAAWVRRQKVFRDDD